jgi:lysophospholipase L1-like esterase
MVAVLGEGGFFYKVYFNFDERYTLTLDEISYIHSATIAYNEVIAELAQVYDFAFFDADAYFSEVSSGIKWNGANFSLEFVSGGFLSLDGLHPNQKGHELLTNEIIKSINSHYKTRIPTINCSDCDGNLFP